MMYVLVAASEWCKWSECCDLHTKRNALNENDSVAEKIEFLNYFELKLIILETKLNGWRFLIQFPFLKWNKLFMMFKWSCQTANRIKNPESKYITSAYLGSMVFFVCVFFVNWMVEWQYRGWIFIISRIIPMFVNHIDTCIIRPDYII